MGDAASTTGTVLLLDIEANANIRIAAKTDATDSCFLYSH
jgi:hypothetical protein